MAFILESAKADFVCVVAISIADFELFILTTNLGLKSDSEIYLLASFCGYKFGVKSG